MGDLQHGRAELTAFSQLIQELISGAVARHTFNEWEVEMLLDLQSCQIRKSARADLLRRYLKAVQQGFAEGESSPLRLSSFVERRRQRRKEAHAGAQKSQAAVHASHG